MYANSKYFLMAAMLLLLSRTAFSGLTSPIPGQLEGFSVEFQWTDDAAQFWLRVYDDGVKYFDSGRLFDNAPIAVSLPEDGSSILAIFYRNVDGQWLPETFEYVSTDGGGTSGSLVRINNECSGSGNEIDVKIIEEGIAQDFFHPNCVVQCPAGYSALSTEGTGYYINDDNVPRAPQEFMYDSYTAGLGSRSVTVFFSDAGNLREESVIPQSTYEEILDRYQFVLNVSAICAKF